MPPVDGRLAMAGLVAGFRFTLDIEGRPAPPGRAPLGRVPAVGREGARETDGLRAPPDAPMDGRAPPPRAPPPPSRGPPLACTDSWFVKTRTHANSMLTPSSLRKRLFIDMAPVCKTICYCVICSEAEYRLSVTLHFAGAGGLRTIVASKSGMDVSPTIRSKPFMRNLSLSIGSM
jgi:hypothetical protein